MRRYFFTGITVVLAMLFSLVLTLTSAEVLFKYEGRWFPVADVSDLEMTVEDDGTISVEGQYTKIRRCEPIYVLAWIERGVVNESEPLPIEFLNRRNNAVFVRPIGVSRFSWQIGPPRIIKEGMINLAVVHACHGSGFWLTRTPLASFEYPLQ